MTTTSTPRRGRPPMTWLTAGELAELPAGTAVAVYAIGRHDRTIGRVALTTPESLTIVDASGVDHDFTATRIAKGRVLDALFEPGDPVLRRGMSADVWRGGVVRTEAHDVLVEQIGGEFAWLAETEIEPAEARDLVLPAVARGPMPSSRG